MGACRQPTCVCFASEHEALLQASFAVRHLQLAAMSPVQELRLASGRKPVRVTWGAKLNPYNLKLRASCTAGSAVWQLGARNGGRRGPAGHVGPD